MYAEMQGAEWAAEVASAYQDRVKGLAGIARVSHHLLGERNQIEEWLARDPWNGALS